MSRPKLPALYPRRGAGGGGDDQVHRRALPSTLHPPRELPEDTPLLMPSQRAANQRFQSFPGGPAPCPSHLPRHAPDTPPPPRDTPPPPFALPWARAWTRPLPTPSQRAANQRSRASRVAPPLPSCCTRRTRPPTMGHAPCPSRLLRHAPGHASSAVGGLRPVLSPSGSRSPSGSASHLPRGVGAGRPTWRGGEAGCARV